MKKVILLVALGLLLSGCSSVIRGDRDNRFEYGMEITPLDNKSLGEIKSMANKKCKGLNRGLAVNVQYLEQEDQLGFRYYGFNCEKSKKIIEAEKKQEEENKKQIELTSMIDKAKDTCKSLDFTEGTEKFSDCALKLYTQSVDLAAKNNQQIVSQGLGSNVVTIYDPRRDSRAAIKREQGLINGSCTLGDLSGC